MPNEEDRAKIIQASDVRPGELMCVSGFMSSQIHSQKMNVSPEVNYDELAASTDDFNAAMLKAICVEAGMLALRRDATEVNHEDFVEGIIVVQAKKKANLNYYA